jgi:hypothetical protein
MAFAERSCPGSILAPPPASCAMLPAGLPTKGLPRAASAAPGLRQLRIAAVAGRDLRDTTVIEKFVCGTLPLPSLPALAKRRGSASLFTIEDFGDLIEMGIDLVGQLPN